MRLKCPHCHSQLNIVEVEIAGDSSCPLCGSRIPMLDVTVDHRVREKEKQEVQHIGHFELVEKVGMGQFGSVWRAKDTRLHRTVAVKIPRVSELDPLRRAMFLREARAVAMLEHSNIVRIHEVGETEDQVYIVSQFIDGMTLSKKLQLHRPSFVESARLMATIADAVQHAHEKGVIHRDLKPSNILVDSEGHPHVTDFGLAKLTSAEITVTLSGDVLGTPAYMSPEQARGDSHNADPRTDVYSLGVVLYEMLTGQRPFEGSTTLLLRQIQSVDPRSPRKLERSIPRDLETICLKSLSKSPHHRYSTAKEMAEDLRRFLAGESILGRRASPAERGLRWMKRNPLMAAAMLVAMLSSSVALGLGFTARSDGPNYPAGTEVIVTPPLRVKLETEPAGAKVVFFQLSRESGEVVKAVAAPTVSPVDVQLPPNDYFIVAELPDGRFHEVFRRVPQNPTDVGQQFPHLTWRLEQDKSISLPKIQIPPLNVAEGMCELSGAARFEVGTPAYRRQFPEHARLVAPFYIDTQEVSVGDYLKLNQRMPRSQGSKQPPVPENFPLTQLFFNEALEYAEKIGKRLPTDFEYEFAATQGGKTFYPWGNDRPTKEAWNLHAVHEVTSDVTVTDPPILGLFSNAIEIVDSRTAPYPGTANTAWHLDTLSGLILRGGARSEMELAQVHKEGAQYRVIHQSVGPQKLLPEQVGFRCVRSKHPRFKLEDFAVPK